MIKINNTEITGWEHAIRGMRNPMNSWEKSDSVDCHGENCEFCGNCEGEFCSHGVGPNDLKLMKSLRKAGSDHRKYMRMITVYADITAPLYWWKEFDTYKVGTVANSCSTMHKIHEKEFTEEDFSMEHLSHEIGGIELNTPTADGRIDELPISFKNMIEFTIDALNAARLFYLSTKDKKYWWQMIQLLPSSYNQKRTVMLNYEVLTNMYHARKNHKLDEWHDFCDWVRSLPYSELIIGEEEI